MPVDAFDNFQVWCDGRELDVTAAFQEFAHMLEGYERDGVGDRPGLDGRDGPLLPRPVAGGDPITYWLTNRLHYFEPPIAVVRRHWQGIVDSSARDRPTCGSTCAATRVRSGPWPPPPSVTTPASRTTSRTSASGSTSDREHAIAHLPRPGRRARDPDGGHGVVAVMAVGDAFATALLARNAEAGSASPPA